MGFYKDLTGNRYGRLTVLGFAYSKNNTSYWYCKCDCGTEKVISGNLMKSKHIQSCGCLSKELSSVRFRKHGQHGTRLYNIWKNMKLRTSNANCKESERYVLRGISICEEWENDFNSFQEWALDNGYSDELTIDRIDNDKGYYPENCRWTTMKVQNRNKENTYKCKYKGEEKPLTEWAEILGLNYKKVYQRIYRHWDIERAFTTP